MAKADEDNNTDICVNTDDNENIPMETCSQTEQHPDMKNILLIGLICVLITISLISLTLQIIKSEDRSEQIHSWNDHRRTSQSNSVLRLTPTQGLTSEPTTTAAIPLDQACVWRAGFKPREVVDLGYGTDVLCDTVSDGGGWIIFQVIIIHSTIFVFGRGELGWGVDSLVKGAGHLNDIFNQKHVLFNLNCLYKIGEVKQKEKEIRKNNSSVSFHGNGGHLGFQSRAVFHNFLNFLLRALRFGS